MKPLFPLGTVAININDATGSPDEVYIGRAGKGEVGYFGNPCVIDKECPVCGEIHKVKGETLKCYESYLKKRIDSDEEFRNKIQKLNGKKLVCFCDNPLKCHGNVMIKYIDILNNNKKPFELNF